MSHGKYNMYCIGLTGGIASGKSTAAKIFTNFGANLISADKIAREITTHDKSIVSKIASRFGEDILDSDGKIKRPNLRNIIFNDTNARIWLENLLHPLIRQKIEIEIQSSRSKFAVIEIPLLKTRKYFPYLNHVVLMTAPDATKIKRLMQRDNCDSSQALQILNSQPSNQEYQNVSDTIIINDGDELQLQKKIADLLSSLNIQPC